MPFFRSPSKFHRSLLCSSSPSSRRFLSLQNPNPNPNPNPPLDDVGPIACRLATRSVIRFRGRDTFKFLQGLLTNDVRPLAQPLKTTGGDQSSTASSYLSTPNVPFRVPPPIYAALLTPQGRFLYDLFLYRPPSGEVTLDRTGSGPGSDDPEEPFTVMADVDAAALDELLDCFKKYRLRSKVEIENVGEEFCCWQRFGGNLSNNDPENQEPEAGAVGWGMGVDRAGASAAHGNNLGWQWFKDPRLDCLGFRGIFPSSTTPPLVESDKEANEQNYLLWRVERGIAEGSTEIPKGEAIPLEYNLVGLNAVSFDKGCYVGQELVARTHHRGVIRKRLLPVKFTDASGVDVEQEVSPGSDVVDCASNKKVGSVSTALGSRGMGLLKLEDVFKESANLSIKEKGDVKVKVIRPDWWPAEWIQLHEQERAAA